MSERTNRIAEFRKKAGLTQADLAERVGSHWITISKLERGKMQLSFEWAERLSKALGVGEFDLFEDKETEKTVFIEGAVGDRGKISFYFDDKGEEDFEAVLLPLGIQRTVADTWVQIETDDFYPVLNIGDFVRLTYLDTSEQPERYVGRLMAARGEDSDPLVMGILTPSPSTGKYEIRALSGAPRTDMEIKSLLAVTLIVPMPPVEDRKTTQNPPAPKL